MEPLGAAGRRATSRRRGRRLPDSPRAFVSHPQCRWPATCAPAASCPNAQPPQIHAGRSPAATGQSSSLSYSITRREPHARPSPRPRHNKSWPAKGCGAIRHPARARHLRSQDINQCDCPLLGQLRWPTSFSPITISTVTGSVFSAMPTPNLWPIIATPPGVRRTAGSKFSSTGRTTTREFVVYQLAEN